MIIGPTEHKTNIRFKKMNSFRSYINRIDIDYDSKGVIFTWYVYEVNTPQFNRVNRSQYGRGTDFRQDLVEYKGNSFYILTSGTCFIKCIFFILLIKIIQKNL